VPPPPEAHDGSICEPTLASHAIPAGLVGAMYGCRERGLFVVGLTQFSCIDNTPKLALKFGL